MNTSRIDGILVLKLTGTYQQAIAGTLEKKNTVWLKEFGYKEESIAFDIDQLVSSAIFNMPKKNFEGTQADQNDDTSKFFDDNSPTDQEVSDMADMLEMIVKMNTSMKVSELLWEFEKLVDAGLIQSDDGTKFNKLMWKDLKSNDRLRIMYSYISFFVNPLQRLEKMSTKTALKQGQEAIKGEKTLYD